VAPLIVNNSAVYVQARSGIVRELNFDFNTDGFSGDDLTTFAPHLFDGYTILDWTFQQNPDPVIWVVRSDGVLLSLTYVKEQQILAWARHDTGRPVGSLFNNFDFGTGFFESVCCIPEGDEDVLYVAVKRTVNGLYNVGAIHSTRNIERISLARHTLVADEKYMDQHLTYDGRGFCPTTVSTVTLTGGTNWTYDESLTATASGATFATTDVGNSLFINYYDVADATTGTRLKKVIRCKIIAYTSTTVVTVKANRTVPSALRSTAQGDVDKAVDELGGLRHLEGQSVTVFADGNVIANPNNSAYPVYTVTDGSITLPDTYAVITVGIPILADLETLDIDTAQGETLSDKKSIVTAVALRVEGSRGFWAGGKPPVSDVLDPLGGLSETRVREYETYDNPIDRKNEVIEVQIDNNYSSGGRTFIRNVDPLPLRVLSIQPAGMFPFKGGG